VGRGISVSKKEKLREVIVDEFKHTLRAMLQYGPNETVDKMQAEAEGLARAFRIVYGEEWDEPGNE